MGPVREWIKRLWKRIRDSDYFVALYETLAIWAFSSLVPLLAIWLVGRVSKQIPLSTAGLASAWNEFFVPAEVFLYVTAIVSPSFAFMIFHWRARRHTGTYTTLLVIILLLFTATAAVYGVAKTAAEVDASFVSSFAIVVYVLALIVWYITHVFQRRLQQLVTSPRPESGSSISIDARE